MTVAGRRLLWHRERSPSVWLAGPDGHWRSAGSVVATCDTGRGASLQFAQGLVLRERYAHGVYGLKFTHPSLDAMGREERTAENGAGSQQHHHWKVRVRFRDSADSIWYGLGPRLKVRLEGGVEFDPSLHVAAFSRDGRWLYCTSPQPIHAVFEGGSIELEAQAPLVTYWGFAADPEHAMGLWHATFGAKVFDAADQKNISEVSLPEAARARPHMILNMLLSLGWSGASPHLFQNFHARLAALMNTKEASGFLTDLMLCQPDCVVPPEYRRMAPTTSQEPAASRVQQRYARFRAAMQAYWEHCEREWREHGMPAITHPAVLHGMDPVLSSRNEAFMAGPELLVAPCIEPGTELVSIVLPEGPWVHLWTSRQYPGGKTTVHAPHGMPAVFYRPDASFAWLFDSVRQVASRL